MPKSYYSLMQNYLPAVVKDLPSMGLMVEYFILDKQTGQMRRKVMRLTKLTKRITRKRERLLEAQKIADEINAKLRGGWSPLHETIDSKLYTSLSDLKDHFLSSKKSEGCRESTLTAYTSQLGLWLTWCESNGQSSLFSGTYLRHHAVSYMDYMMEKGQRHRSYNSTLKVLKAFWQWALEHCYCKENPFLTFKTLNKEPKIRILVPADARQKVAEFYASHRPAMNIVCQLVYSSAIRPGEILKIQLKHIHLDKHYIEIPAENSKNHKGRMAALTPSLVTMIGEHIKGFNKPDYFLMGFNEELLPDVRAVNKSYFQKSWERMRNATGLPKEMQLYSLRDTGITDLIHAGVDPLTVRHHTDHSSQAIQDIYTDHFDPEVSKAIWESAPSF